MAQTKQPEAGLMRVTDVAIRLGMPSVNVRRLIELGVLKGVRGGPNGGRWLVTTVSVKNLERLRQREQSATTQPA